MKGLLSATLGTLVLGVGLVLAADAGHVKSRPARRPAAQAAPVARPVPSQRVTKSAAPALAVAHAAPAMAATDQNALVDQFCANCHNDSRKSGGLSLEDFDAATVTDHPEVAEKMIRKLRAGMMPPANAKRPEPAVVSAFVDALETRIDRAAALTVTPGWRPFQRLNRAEYTRAVRDLLDLDIDAAAFLPPDTISHGFDNVADAQTFSPALMEGYLRAAGKVAALALGDAEATPSEASYKLPKTASQLHRADGAPLGTRGGISVVHTFPADGDYVFRMDFYAEPLGLLYGNTARGEQIEVSIDGERVAVLGIDPRMNEQRTGLSLKTPTIHVKAGPQRVTAAFIQTFEGPINDLIAPIDHTMADTEIGTAYGITTLPHLRSLYVVGPHRVTGVSDTPSRRRIFTCRPTNLEEESLCARDIIRGLATRAFRGPVGTKDFIRLMRFYEEGRTGGRNFEAGIGSAVEAILASPQFLFKLEPTAAPLRAGQVYRLGDFELASRLSFFLWGAGPDAELLTVADQGRLSAPGVLAKQTRRMLADPRAEALATRFGSQWLRLQDLDKVFPDPIQFPYYDNTLMSALRRETELFFESLVREDRSVLDLISADYTFVNERLAKHYGIPNVTGDAFRRVPLPEYRRGILGHGSVLTLTSNSDRTSPVQRGKWVMEVLLGTPPPPPPPNVPALDATKASSGGKLLTVRQRMEEHRANPACNSCHRVIDPLGLALENFDATGKWRINDGEFAVDPAGVLYDGAKMDGPAGLRAALVKHKDVFLLSFTESLMTYALGRRVEPQDMPTVRRIIRGAARNEYRVSSFLQGVIDSAPFRMTTGGPAALTTTDQAR